MTPSVKLIVTESPTKSLLLLLFLVVTPKVTILLSSFYLFFRSLPFTFRLFPSSHLEGVGRPDR